MEQNGQYGVASFCIANAVVQVPFVLLIALCCSTPVYWITDMNDESSRQEWSGQQLPPPRLILRVLGT